jgi:hypothetical protein
MCDGGATDVATFLKVSRFGFRRGFDVSFG